MPHRNVWPAAPLGNYLQIFARPFFKCSSTQQRDDFEPELLQFASPVFQSHRTRFQSNRFEKPGWPTTRLRKPSGYERSSLITVLVMRRTDDSKKCLPPATEPGLDSCLKMSTQPCRATHAPPSLPLPRLQVLTLTSTGSIPRSVPRSSTVSTSTSRDVPWQLTWPEWLTSDPKWPGSGRDSKNTRQTRGQQTTSSLASTARTDCEPT